VNLFLVDDEPLSRARLRDMLVHCPDCRISGEAENGAAAVALLAETAADIVLLDYEMPGMNGMAFAALARQRWPHLVIIFITAYEQHALAAYEHGAIDYLLKPVSRRRLRAALDRAARWRAAQASGLSLTIRSGQHLDRLPLEHILWCRAEDKYVTLHHLGGTVVTDLSLAELERRAGDFFLRIHRRTLIARQRLCRLVKSGEINYVQLDGYPERLLVSRRHLPAVRAALVTPSPAEHPNP